MPGSARRRHVRLPLPGHSWRSNSWTTPTLYRGSQSRAGRDSSIQSGGPVSKRQEGAEWGNCRSARWAPASPRIVSCGSTSKIEGSICGLAGPPAATVSRAEARLVAAETVSRQEGGGNAPKCPDLGLYQSGAMESNQECQVWFRGLVQSASNHYS